MLQPKRQLSDTERKRRDQVWDILSAALAAVDPAQAIPAKREPGRRQPADRAAEL